MNPVESGSLPRAGSLNNRRLSAVLDANEAVAAVAYQASEVIAIYPITPSSAMGESADAWMAEGRTNLWDVIPSVVEMQSEAGAAGALHGALQTGSLACTFTASQGLLLMIPNMYKIAGELTPVVFHVAARSLATQALSIFGDHSDVMSARSTGFAMLASGSVQEAQDLAAVAHAATLESRIPFLHFFDGFRTSHEISKIEPLSRDTLKALIPEPAVREHRARALTPENPVLRGTAQNPEVYFQARESVNPFYARVPDILEKVLERFAGLTGRRYRLYDYEGAPDADRVIVIMGSGGETAAETVAHLNEEGAKTGVLRVRLFRPLDTRRLIAALPATVRKIAVLDRTKEPGSAGEPLFQDLVSAVLEDFQRGSRRFGGLPVMTGGRYGLSSKEFTPGMVRAVFENLKLDLPRTSFTVGIQDDVSGLSLPYDDKFSLEPDDVFRGLFYGLGSDGTVSANKNSIKIIGDSTDFYVQGYFVYDSKKAGAVTVSHLRFGPRPIRSPYLIQHAQFVACHQPVFLERTPQLLDALMPGGIFLLNAPWKPEEAWDRVPRVFQEKLVAAKASFYLIDADAVAHKAGLGGRVNTVMQACFFAVSGVLPREQALEKIKKSIEKTYAKKGEEIVRLNLRAVDACLENLHQIHVPSKVTGNRELHPAVPAQAPEFVQKVLGRILAGEGDCLPVSAFPVDGTYPTATAQWEKRNLASEIPVWDTGLCIQCGKCAMVCPHAVIRIKAYEPAAAAGAPATFKTTPARDADWKGLNYTIQVAPEDCTGCGICVDVCPARSKTETRIKALVMSPQPPLREDERRNWDFFLGIQELDRSRIKPASIRQQQVQQPLFEFSGACAGCGETPYLKLASQLFGDRMVIANATGCSSIYGGNLPTTPWAKNRDGQGPAWSNSLFEDNAEFGLGMRVSLDHQASAARELVFHMAPQLGTAFAEALLKADQKDEAGIYEQRIRVRELKQKLAALKSDEARRMETLADALVKKSVWIVGGDGWAYDIGFGGLDHVLASGRNVNVLVLDTEVYSNTGGQMSKATPRGAVAKFAAAGRRSAKKDLGLMAMTYGNVYVGRVAMGAKDEHTLKTFIEAEAYEGPSLIIAYSHCIAHGINMTTGLQNQKAAVESGQWVLYRFNPEKIDRGENPMTLDSARPRIPVEQYLLMENRFKMLTKVSPDAARELFKQSQQDADVRRRLYEYLAGMNTQPPQPPGGKTS